MLFCDMLCEALSLEEEKHCTRGTAEINRSNPVRLCCLLLHICAVYLPTNLA